MHTYPITLHEVLILFMDKKYRNKIKNKNEDRFMLKKVSYVVFIIVMMVIITSCGSSAIDIWDGSVAASFAGGDGSAEGERRTGGGSALRRNRSGFQSGRKNQTDIVDRR